MQLKNISISLEMWGENRGKVYSGEVTYINPCGEIKLILTPELSTKVLSCLSDEINNIALTGVLGLKELIKNASLKA